MPKKLEKLARYKQLPNLTANISETDRENKIRNSSWSSTAPPVLGKKIVGELGPNGNATVTPLSEFYTTDALSMSLQKSSPTKIAKQ